MVELSDLNWHKCNQKQFNNRQNIYLCLECSRKRWQQDRNISLNLISDVKTPNAKTYLDRKNQLSMIRLLKTKIHVIDYYGGKCNICGIMEIDMLTIDHINDDGAAHRKNSEAKTIYNWLNKNNFPDGYQVLCYNCNCTKNYTKESKNKKYNIQRKQKVIDHYGGSCVECGEFDILKLTLDHIHNNGSEHRKQNNYGTGTSTYKWVVKNNYPDNIFQILCWNCNCSKNIKNKRKIDSENLLIILSGRVNKAA